MSKRYARLRWPPFANCGLNTLLINLTVPGAGNTITLTLGKGKVIL